MPADAGSATSLRTASQLCIHQSPRSTISMKPAAGLALDLRSTLSPTGPPSGGGAIPFRNCRPVQRLGASSTRAPL
eukprot:6553914-Pyramimonas_sp.AAC.1